MRKFWMIVGLAVFVLNPCFAETIVDRDGDILDINPSGGILTESAANATLGSGVQTTLGGAVQLSTADVACNRVLIKANLGNTGNIYIGDSNVYSGIGFPLDAGEIWVGTIDNLNKIY